MLLVQVRDAVGTKWSECHTEKGKSEREKQILHINTYTWNLGKWHRQSCLQSRNIDTDIGNLCVDTRGDKAGVMSWEIGIDTYTVLILYRKWITNENILSSTENSTSCTVVTWMGRKSKREGMYAYVELTHFAVQRKLTEHCKTTMLQ